MKAKLTLCLVHCCMLALILNTGCKKGPIAGEENPCQIQKIVIPSHLLVASNRVKPIPYIARNIPNKVQSTSNITPGASDTLTFTYNTSSNPVSMTHQMNIGENILFKYDKWDRLTEYINIFPGGTAGDYWHKYTYDKVNTDRIIADTAFRDFISSNGQLTLYNDIDLTVFKYDALGRISQTTEYVLGDTIVRLYNYDTRGNLQRPGSLYDNNPNIHLTNKIWMFLDRDYSVNNPVDNESYTYNGNGFPITISNSASVAPGLGFIVIGYPFAITRSNIYYSCP